MRGGLTAHLYLHDCDMPNLSRLLLKLFSNGDPLRHSQRTGTHEANEAVRHGGEGQSADVGTSLDASKNLRGGSISATDFEGNRKFCPDHPQLLTMAQRTQPNQLFQQAIAPDSFKSLHSISLDVLASHSDDLLPIPPRNGSDSPYPPALRHFLTWTLDTLYVLSSPPFSFLHDEMVKFYRC